LLNGDWRSGVGGPAWGQAAHLLRLYETEQISAIVFVDSAFGLEHNNGCIFNKLWGGGRKLKEVLDDNLNRDEKKPRSGQRVKVLRGKWAGEVARYDITVKSTGLARVYDEDYDDYVDVPLTDLEWGGMKIVVEHAPEAIKRRYKAWAKFGSHAQRE
jgi:hypothetical protein